MTLDAKCSLQIKKKKKFSISAREIIRMIRARGE